MTREELRNKYGDEICELCCREYFTNRAYPDSFVKVVIAKMQKIVSQMNII